MKAALLGLIASVSFGAYAHADVTDALATATDESQLTTPVDSEHVDVDKGIFYDDGQARPATDFALPPPGRGGRGGGGGGGMRPGPRPPGGGGARPAPRPPGAQPGRPTRPPGAQPGRPTRPPGAQPGRPTRPPGAQPGRPTRPPGARPGRPTRPPGAQPGRPTRPPGARPGRPTRPPGAQPPHRPGRPMPPARPGRPGHPPGWGPGHHGGYGRGWHPGRGAYRHHPDWRPGYRWDRNHHPRWWYAGIHFPLWFWDIGAPSRYYQCIAFDKGGDDATPYVGFAPALDEAAFNALYACGGPDDCYIPPGYCKRR